jgi:pilus assembly protein Flp/PilA
VGSLRTAASVAVALEAAGTRPAPERNFYSLPVSRQALGFYGWKGRNMELIALVKNFGLEDDGVTAIEYGLIAALIAIVIIAGATLVGTNLDALFTYISTKLVT